MTQPTTVILPAKREATNLEALLPRRRQACPEAEILLVDAGGQHELRRRREH